MPDRLMTALVLDDIRESCDTVSRLEKALNDAREVRNYKLREARRSGILYARLVGASGMTRESLVRLIGSREDLNVMG